MEDAILFVNNNNQTDISTLLPTHCQNLPKPRVVYGDTDSLFVYMEGYGKQEAFDTAHSLADAITMRNPAPILLKVEKVCHNFIYFFDHLFNFFLYNFT